MTKKLIDIRTKFTLLLHYAKKIHNFYSRTWSNWSIELRYFTPPFRPGNLNCHRTCRNFFKTEFGFNSSTISFRRTFLPSVVKICANLEKLLGQTCFECFLHHTSVVTSNSANIWISTTFRKSAANFFVLEVSTCDFVRNFRKG